MEIALEKFTGTEPREEICERKLLEIVEITGLFGWNELEWNGELILRPLM